MRPHPFTAMTTSEKALFGARQVSLPEAKLPGRQKRIQRRMPHRVPCRVRLVEPTTGLVRHVAGETVNLSPGGMALQVSLDVPLGTWVETMVPHTHGDPLFLCGTVVHVRRTLASNYEIGVSMVDHPPRPLA